VRACTVHGAFPSTRLLTRTYPRRPPAVPTAPPLFASAVTLPRFWCTARPPFCAFRRPFPTPILTQLLLTNGAFLSIKYRALAIAPHLNRRSDAMLPIEEAIIEKLRSGPCSFDEVVTGLPNFSWGEIFTAVDCMSRDRRVFLRQLGYSTYEISLGSRHTEFSSATSENGMQSSLSG